MKLTIIYFFLVFFTINPIFGQEKDDDEKLFRLISQEVDTTKEIVRLETNNGVFEDILEVKNLCERADLKKLMNDPKRNMFAENACIKYDTIFQETFTSENLEFLKSQINLVQNTQNPTRTHKMNIVFITKPIYNLSRKVAYVRILTSGGVSTGVYIKENYEWKYKGIFHCYIY